MTTIEVSDRVSGPASRYPQSAVLPAHAAPPDARSGTGRYLQRPPAPPDLVGRERDMTVISAFVAEMGIQGGAMLLYGEPGIGKSALLDAAAEASASSGVRVLRAAGAEFEDLGFAGLNQLVLPLRGDLDQLADYQRDALEVALGFSDGSARDRLVVANALLALLSRAAADRPLLLLVDNWQWLDQASALVLGFVARRLHGSRAGILAAQRPGAPGLADLGVPVYEVPPLDDDASARLLAVRFAGLAPGIQHRIVTEARGNPLALLELTAGFSDNQRSGRAALPATLPVNGRMRALVSSRVAALPAAAGWLLLLAALDVTGDLGLLRAAAAGQGETDDLASAGQAGLVHVDEAARRVSFANPLIRSAVLELWGNADVRRAHLALAAQLGDQPERQAWHLAGAAVERGEPAVGLVKQAARQPQDRGDASRAQQLAVDGYRAAGVACDLNAAQALLADARQAGLGRAPSAETTLATAFLLLHMDGDAAAAHRLLLGLEAAADESAGPRRAADTATLHLQVCRLSGRAEHWESLERFVVTSGSAVPASVRDAVLVALDPGAAIGRLDAELESLAYRTEPADIVRIASASAAVDRLPDCRSALYRAAHPVHAGNTGSSGRLGTTALRASTLLAAEAYQTGQWDEAWRLAETAAGHCAGAGHQLLRHQAQTVRALVAASRGDIEAARGFADEIARWGAPRGLTHLLHGAHYAYVLADLAGSDFQAAYQQAARISPVGHVSVREPFAAWALLDLVEAALRTGRRDDAVAHAQAGRRSGLAAVSPRLALLSAATMAMIAPDDKAQSLFELSLASEDAGRWPFDRARVQLLYGERLRRMRELHAARTQLDAALDEFRRLGAVTWADRAASGLRAAGQPVPRAGRSDYQVLTQQELEVARLAAAGLSNRQIADRLFVSHRTVGSHLYQIFPKLGITSRAALSGALPKRAGPTGVITSR